MASRGNFEVSRFAMSVRNRVFGDQPSRATVILMRLSSRRQLHHVLRRRFDEIADVPSPLL